MSALHLFYRVHLSRMLLESLIVSMVVWLVLVLLDIVFPPSILRSLIIFLAGPLCLFWGALRLAVPESSWWRQCLCEIALTCLLSLMLSCMALALNLLPHGGLAPDPHWKRTSLEAAGVALTLNAFTFVAARIGLRLWLSWNQLRRKQLLWSFTHVHLTAIALVVGLLASLFVLWMLFTSPNLALFVVTILSLLALALGIIIVILPISLLFSYLLVRRMLPRLRALAAATNVLRSGNYAQRIPVTGEDEIAQLQVNFNAMAAELEQTIGEREQAMHALQDERDIVTKLLQERRELFANVSHELRTPMATLRSYLEITLAHWDTAVLPSALQHNLQVMEGEVIQLQTLTDDLFALARAEVGRLTIQNIPVDIGAIALYISAARAPLARQSSRVEVVADIPSMLPSVMGDPGCLGQVLQNLLHNAVRHTPPGGIVAIVITVEPAALLLQVKDTGEGIAESDMSHIWQRFYQADSLHNRTNNATGLGLALVKEWVEAMHGTITVESVVGEGSCFSIRFPLNQQ